MTRMLLVASSTAVSSERAAIAASLKPATFLTDAASALKRTVSATASLKADSYSISPYVSALNPSTDSMASRSDWNLFCSALSLSYLPMRAVASPSRSLNAFWPVSPDATAVRSASISFLADLPACLSFRTSLMAVELSTLFCFS